MVRLRGTDRESKLMMTVTRNRVASCRPYSPVYEPRSTRGARGMKSRGRGHWVRTVSGALLALAAVAFAQGTARAGCSRHVLPHSEPLAGISHLEILTRFD